ncbi:protein homolog of mammalian lyst-interacting protein 5 [Phtheirospermum japonicum]|uniref:Protein homolog of mammalian lyst-interacting protein 5 n=1 Tax=Phtheirospermum japonicum TaxID=374723 RepID=A0A830BST5_9LAMI|nr:protein homolog of mammalian lyst-interacting protein 5 [Phtheirospermum japonicum]
MATENEPAKLLLPYLQRADELQKHEPLVAYYCRLYAMERGLKFPQSDRTKTTNALLVSLMKQLEKDKKSLNLGPDDHLHVEGFGLNVFSRADKQDRAGRADLNTAKTFYAASIFFEILNQFGELQPDVEQKQKYAVWKAADIRKALKEGKKPIPGPPGGDKDLSVLSSASSGEYDLESRRSDVATMPDPTRLDPPAVRIPPDSVSSPQAYNQDNIHQPTDFSRQPLNVNKYPSEQHLKSYPSFQSYPSFTESSLPQAPTHYPSFADSSPPSNTAAYASTCQYNSNDSSYQPPPEKIAEAHKTARFAVGALAFDDVSIAVEHLKKSLELLTNPSAGH